MASSRPTPHSLPKNSLPSFCSLSTVNQRSGGNSLSSEASSCAREKWRDKKREPARAENPAEFFFPPATLGRSLREAGVTAVSSVLGGYRNS